VWQIYELFYNNKVHIINNSHADSYKKKLSIVIVYGPNQKYKNVNVIIAIKRLLITWIYLQNIIFIYSR